MKVTPLSDRILVKADPKEETVGTIIIAQERPLSGSVVAVGPGRVLETGQLVPMNVKVGDKVFFGKFAGSPLRLGDEEFLVMSEPDVLVKVV